MSAFSYIVTRVMNTKNVLHGTVRFIIFYELLLLPTTTEGLRSTEWDSLQVPTVSYE